MLGTGPDIALRSVLPSLGPLSHPGGRYRSCGGGLEGLAVAELPKRTRRTHRGDLTVLSLPNLLVGLNVRLRSAGTWWVGGLPFCWRKFVVVRGRGRALIHISSSVEVEGADDYICVGLWG